MSAVQACITYPLHGRALVALKKSVLKGPGTHATDALHVTERDARFQLGLNQAAQRIKRTLRDPSDPFVLCQRDRFFEKFRAKQQHHIAVNEFVHAQIGQQFGFVAQGVNQAS